MLLYVNSTYARADMSKPLAKLEVENIHIQGKYLKSNTHKFKACMPELAF